MKTNSKLEIYIYTLSLLIYHGYFIATSTKYGSFVTDSLESEIKQHGKIRIGNFISGNDCLTTSTTHEGKTIESCSTLSSVSSFECSFLFRGFCLRLL